MSSGNHLRPIDPLGPYDSSRDHLDDPAFVVLLRRIADRFADLTGLTAIAVPLDLQRVNEASDPPSNPGHPTCADFFQCDYCAESWQLHVEEMRTKADPHWHTCNYGLLCAVVPMVCRGQVRAAFKLVSEDALPVEDFVQHVELLDLLVKGYATHLARPAQGTGVVDQGPVEDDAEVVARSPDHAQVVQAVDYIEQHLAEPKLTVARIAREVGIHPDYLSHLFAEQVDQRMTRYINDRRMERARELLASTTWQIQRIAGEVGYANANWFSHLFHTSCGQTPSEYRALVRRRVKGSASGSDPVPDSANE